MDILTLTLRLSLYWSMCFGVSTTYTQPSCNHIVIPLLPASYWCFSQHRHQHPWKNTMTQQCSGHCCVIVFAVSLLALHSSSLCVRGNSLAHNCRNSHPTNLADVMSQ